MGAVLVEWLKCWGALTYKVHHLPLGNLAASRPFATKKLTCSWQEAQPLEMSRLLGKAVVWTSRHRTDFPKTLKNGEGRGHYTPV